jgi:superfamily II RNA helicase
MNIWLFCLVFGFSSAFVRLAHHPSQSLNHQLSRVSTPLYTKTEPLTDVDAVLDTYRHEIASLRGTPELVDKLENLASKHPGIELNINTYRMIYPFPLDQFQIDGLSSLINGNSVLVSTPTGSGESLSFTDLVPC